MYLSSIFSSCNSSPTLPQEESLETWIWSCDSPQQKMLSGSLFSLGKCPRMLAPCSQPLLCHVTTSWVLSHCCSSTTSHTFYSTSLSHFQCSDSSMLFPASLSMLTMLSSWNVSSSLCTSSELCSQDTSPLRSPLFPTPSAFQAFFGLLLY